MAAALRDDRMTWKIFELEFILCNKILKCFNGLWSGERGGYGALNTSYMYPYVYTYIHIHICINIYIYTGNDGQFCKEETRLLTCISMAAVFVSVWFF